MNNSFFDTIVALALPLAFVAIPIFFIWRIKCRKITRALLTLNFCLIIAALLLMLHHNIRFGYANGDLRYFIERMQQDLRGEHPEVLAEKMKKWRESGNFVGSLRYLLTE